MVVNTTEFIVRWLVTFSPLHRPMSERRPTQDREEKRLLDFWRTIKQRKG